MKGYIRIGGYRYSGRMHVVGWGTYSYTCMSPTHQTVEMKLQVTKPSGMTQRFSYNRGCNLYFSAIACTSRVICKLRRINECSARDDLFCGATSSERNVSRKQPQAN